MIFLFLAPCPTSGQVVYSDNDELVTKESINELDNRIKSQKGVEGNFFKIKGANHFFKDKEKDLRTEIEKYIKEKLNFNLIFINSPPLHGAEQPVVDGKEIGR